MPRSVSNHAPKEKAHHGRSHRGKADEYEDGLVRSLELPKQALEIGADRLGFMEEFPPKALQFDLDFP